MPSLVYVHLHPTFFLKQREEFTMSVTTANGRTAYIYIFFGIVLSFEGLPFPNVLLSWAEQSIYQTLKACLPGRGK